MTPDISERAFEAAIECALLRGGPDACPGDAAAVRESPPTFGDEPAPGGYHRRRAEDYDRALCLVPTDVVDFLLATQPRQWEKLTQHHGADVKSRFLGRLSREIARRGALDVLRNGVKDSGCKFRLAYFRPASGLNEELQRLHAANLFAVVRQLRFSEHDEQSLDLALFLNGIPVFTAELKNPLNGQDVRDAIRQYREDRDPREPLFGYARCLAHFAVDPEQVFVTTCLAGPKTRFLPFNRGRFGGAGNPPVPPTRDGFPTDYLWEEVWARDSVLDLVRQFIHEVEAEDDRGRKTGGRFLIFPRYQQLDCVRRLVRHARDHGAGERYLVQHSAGSGKSFTIAWLAHRLSVLHDRGDRRVFDSVVVVTDRPRPRVRAPAPRRASSAQHPAVRADPRGGGEHRPDLGRQLRDRGPRGGPHHHRHHPAEVPGHRRADRRAADRGPALRGDRGSARGCVTRRSRARARRASRRCSRPAASTRHR